MRPTTAGLVVLALLVVVLLGVAFALPTAAGPGGVEVVSGWSG